MTADELIAFEDEVGAAMKAGKIRTPTHLCGGNEAELIDIFKGIGKNDWIFASYRNHYHALLHGVPREQVMEQIVAGHSMTPVYPGRKFFTSAIVGGVLPIAVGVAMALKAKGSSDRVWCFVGDMAATTGAFHEASRYASGHELPIRFIVEDNGLSCDTPTAEVWGRQKILPDGVIRYRYKRVRPHLGAAH